MALQVTTGSGYRNATLPDHVVVRARGNSLGTITRTGRRERIPEYQQGRVWTSPKRGVHEMTGIENCCQTLGVRWACYQLKTLDTFGNSLTWCIITNMGKYIGNRSCNRKEWKTKTHLFAQLICVLSDASKRLLMSFNFSEKLPVSTMLLRREPFLTMLYTTNSSSLLVTN